MSHLPLSLMNRLNKTESAVFKLWMLYFERISIQIILIVPQAADLSLFSFVRGRNLFSVSKFICSPKKESQNLKNLHFGQIHVQFVFFRVSH